MAVVSRECFGLMIMIWVVIRKMSADLKPLLIDLEASVLATGRKQEKSVQRERLSEEGYIDSQIYIVCDSPAHELIYTM